MNNIDDKYIYRKKAGIYTTDSEIQVHKDHTVTGNAGIRKKSAVIVILRLIAAAAVLAVAGCAAAAYFRNNIDKLPERNNEEYHKEDNADIAGYTRAISELTYGNYEKSYYEDGLLHLAVSTGEHSYSHRKVSFDKGEEEIVRDLSEGTYYNGKWYSDKDFISGYFDSCEMRSSCIRDDIYTAVTEELVDEEYGRYEYFLYVSDLKSGKTVRNNLIDIIGLNPDTPVIFAGASYYENKIYAAGFEIYIENNEKAYKPCIYVFDNECSLVDTITGIPIDYFHSFAVNDDGTAVVSAYINSNGTSAVVIDLKEKSILSSFELEGGCELIPGTDINHMYYQRNWRSDNENTLSDDELDTCELYSFNARTAESDLIRDFTESDDYSINSFYEFEYCSDSEYVYTVSDDSPIYTECIVDINGNITDNGPQSYLENISRYSGESEAVKASQYVRKLFPSAGCELINGDDIYGYYAVCEGILYGIGREITAKTRLADISSDMSGKPDAVMSDAEGNIIIVRDNQIIKFAPVSSEYTVINVATHGNVNPQMDKLAEKFSQTHEGVKVIYTPYKLMDIDEIQSEITSDTVISGVSDESDVILFDQLFSLHDYEKIKNIRNIADLSEVMKKDPDYNDENYLTNIIESFADNGQQRIIPLNFWVRSFGTSKTAEKYGISINDYINMLSEAEGRMFLHTGLRCDSTDALAFDSSPDYINFEEKTAFYNNDKFINLIKSIKNNTVDTEYPPESDDEFFSFYSYIYPFRLIDEGRPDMTHITGLPSDTECYSMAVSDYTAAVFENPENKEMCWEFIRFLIDENFSLSDSAYKVFPVNRECYDELVDTIQNNIGNENIEKLRLLIDGISYAYRYDSTVNGIISSYLASYFYGEISAEEAAEDIQNSVTEYFAGKK